MVSVKKFKPYYIKSDTDYVRLILCYRYITIFINGEEYQFIPIKTKEIKINRKTRKNENIEDQFAFQKGNDVIYITMNELIYLPDFLIHVYDIAKPYYTDIQEQNDETNEIIIAELERLNIKRLIDKALDERDEQSFFTLINLL